jgi:hypothetical protein
MARLVRATRIIAGVWTGGPDKPGHDEGKKQSLPSKIPFRRCANPVGTRRAMTMRFGADTIPVSVKTLQAGRWGYVGILMFFTKLARCVQAVSRKARSVPVET